jgi:phospholipase A1
VFTASLATPAHAADEPSRYDQCLLDALRVAYDDQTVAALREKCRSAKPSQKTEGGVSLPVRSDTPVAERRFGSDVGELVDRLGVLPHRPNYFLPGTYGTGFNQVDDTAKRAEIMFQLSLKLPFTFRSLTKNPNTPVVYFAYTGQAWWQAYNSDRSSPFREYNHSPEVYVSLPLAWQLSRWRTRYLDLGFEHHSNGRAPGGSRSWNRLFAKIDFEYGANYWLSLKSWWRIPESQKATPDAPEGDDNPDITRYYGHHELRIGKSSSRLNWNLMLRRSLRSKGKGAVELNLSYPTGFNPRTRWYLRLFDGYGESLIDYNRRVRRIGVGIMVNDWY